MPRLTPNEIRSHSSCAAARPASGDASGETCSLPYSASTPVRRNSTCGFAESRTAASRPPPAPAAGAAAAAGAATRPPDAGTSRFGTLATTPITRMPTTATAAAPAIARAWPAARRRAPANASAATPPSGVSSAPNAGTIASAPLVYFPYIPSGPYGSVAACSMSLHGRTRASADSWNAYNAACATNTIANARVAFDAARRGSRRARSVHSAAIPSEKAAATQIVRVASALCTSNAATANTTAISIVWRTTTSAVPAKTMAAKTALRGAAWTSASRHTATANHTPAAHAVAASVASHPDWCGVRWNR